jgi:hypothetical protein
MRAFSMNMPFAALVAHGYTNPNPNPNPNPHPNPNPDPQPPHPNPDPDLDYGPNPSPTPNPDQVAHGYKTIESRNGTMFAELAGQTVILHVGQRTYPDGGKHVEIMRDNGE